MQKLSALKPIKRNKKPRSQKKFLSGLMTGILDNRMNRSLMRYFEWPLVIVVVLLSLYGVVCIFAATGDPLENRASMTFMEAVRSQPVTYARLQLIWIAVGLIALAGTVFFDYQWYGTLANVLYWGNVLLLLLVLLATEAGRGGANMFFTWGGGSRTFQPAEFGKLAIIIALAKLFANREAPIRRVSELFRVACYVGLPLMLIVLQPDVGTALVYIAIFAALVFASGTDYKLIIGVVCILILIAVPAWYVFSYSESFRLERIQVWLDPEYDINNAGMQTYNARIALGSGGLFGKGLFSEGNYAALKYIPDDHTDFIFAIVGETFGFVGAGVMIAMFLFIILRMMALALRAQDPFGSYLVIGVMAMLLFHIFENISMVIGLMPVTGIPLPFVSYGGSSYLTNMIGIGLVVNVAMRSRAKTGRTARATIPPAKL